MLLPDDGQLSFQVVGSLDSRRAYVAVGYYSGHEKHAATRGTPQHKLGLLLGLHAGAALHHQQQQAIVEVKIL